jgi:hypothetical protein
MPTAMPTHGKNPATLSGIGTKKSEENQFLANSAISCNTAPKKPETSASTNSATCA